VFNSLEIILQRICAVAVASPTPPLPKLGEGAGG
jgi:hypothetical protein